MLSAPSGIPRLTARENILASFGVKMLGDEVVRIVAENLQDGPDAFLLRLLYFATSCQFGKLKRGLTAIVDEPSVQRAEKFDGTLFDIGHVNHFAGALLYLKFFQVCFGVDLACLTFGLLCCFALDLAL